MEQKEFVTKTILDIVDGVGEAQSENRTTAEINAGTTRKTEHVEFDVSVIVTEEAGKGRGISVSIPSLASIKTAKDQGSGQMIEQRVKFSVPIVYPFPHQPNRKSRT